ncbi:MAG: response regulator [Actinobacteria bacterium]|nr:response regulator [Actinomycetota bacterium]
MDESDSILLVEDNADDIELAMLAFKRHGIADCVNVALDGGEALDFLRGRGRFADRAGAPNPRVILLDIKMPLVNGLELLREIKADQRTRKIPVVVLTSSRDERDVETAYDLGVNGYVAKPAGFSEFVDLIGLLKRYWLEVNESPPDSV